MYRGRRVPKRNSTCWRGAATDSLGLGTATAGILATGGKNNPRIQMHSCCPCFPRLEPLLYKL